MQPTPGILYSPESAKTQILTFSLHYSDIDALNRWPYTCPLFLSIHILLFFPFIYLFKACLHLYLFHCNCPVPFLLFSQPKTFPAWYHTFLQISSLSLALWGM